MATSDELKPLANVARSSALPSEFVSRSAVIPPLLFGPWRETNTSPFGATHRWRAPRTVSKTVAQNPAGNLSPALSGSHFVRALACAPTRAGEDRVSSNARADL